MHIYNHFKEDHHYFHPSLDPAEEHNPGVVAGAVSAVVYPSPSRKVASQEGVLYEDGETNPDLGRATRVKWPYPSILMVTNHHGILIAVIVRMIIRNYC